MESLTPVPHGHLAAVVTHLELRARAEMTADHSGLTLERWYAPDLGAYRTLFSKVGLPWLWYSRLVMDDEAVQAIITHQHVHIYKVRSADGSEAGLVELNFSNAGECEIAFLGLMPDMTGQGHGRWLMAEVLRLAWQGAANGADIQRIWLHTCSFDHPGALGFYRRSGFTAYAREIEVYPDPRLSDKLPRSAAPHVPILD